MTSEGRDEEYMDLIRSYATPEELRELLRLHNSPKDTTEFHTKLKAIVQRHERKQWIISVIFKAFIALGGVGGVLLTLRSLAEWLESHVR